ncbi:hypothetical protein SERLA73DRAFT_159969 [Serpula lacrymans var. lacrymans S7.3]|uniref:CCHC-type domain-containing protein n=1 Tax=Serpula lacrymans var. lacrymans (strain S7.3) TaxID=936435 RepID=F8PVK7_SERL3|nr:hypothetical protein SERLA73DRAFT_159969 [Serpula lacrymans var. lacrymans S7.3]
MSSGYLLEGRQRVCFVVDTIEQKSIPHNTHEEERARYEIIYKKQGTLTAQEFFVKFEELRRRAGYDVKRNEQFLITLIRNNINGPLIKQIIYSGNVPTTYTEWKTRIVTNDQLWRDQVENERMLKGSTNGSSGTGNRGPNGRYQEKGASERKTETVEAKKDGTGTLYTGAGKEMEVDKQKFRTEGRCFKCGEKGHRARDHLNGQTPQKPKFDLRAMLEAMPEEERANLLQDAQDLKRKEQSMKEENLKGKRVEKIPKKDAAHSKEKSAAAPKRSGTPLIKT